MNGKIRHAVRFLGLAVVALILGVVALTWGSVPIASAGGGNYQPFVKVTATTTQPDAEGRQVITITMDIEKGYFILANPVQYDDLEPAQTIVKIVSANKLNEVKIDYPPGKREVSGKDSYFIYEDKVEIRVTLKRAEDDTGPLDLSVKCHPFGRRGPCLLPEQVKLQVK
jgi:hypothetical protein